MFASHDCPVVPLGSPVLASDVDPGSAVLSPVSGSDPEDVVESATGDVVEPAPVSAVALPVAASIVVAGADVLALSPSSADGPESLPLVVVWVSAAVACWSSPHPPNTTSRSGAPRTSLESRPTPITRRS